jgi:E3 ubiquitin-protein ligase RNF19A
MEPFDEELIKKYVNAEIFNKFQRYVENQKVLLNPMLRFCPNCPSGIIKLNNENDPKATCPECKAEVCTKCNRRFHNKTSCQAVMEGELKNWTNKKEVQRCPKCKILVEKVEGCNHMTCFVCRYEFCWLCRGAYTSVHFFPLNPLGCPGLQGMKTKIHKWNCLKILLIRFLCLILCVVLLPFAILLYMPVFFFAFVFDSRFYRRNIRDNGFCLKITFITFLVLLCIVLEPIFIAIEVIGVIPALIFLLVEYISERRRRNRKIVIAQRNIIPVDI